MAFTLQKNQYDGTCIVFTRFPIVGSIEESSHRRSLAIFNLLLYFVFVGTIAENASSRKKMLENSKINFSVGAAVL